MKLYFVRHTTPADSAVSDVKRPLTRHGEEEARQVGMALDGMKVQPARVYSSPLLRARQTAAIIAQQVKFSGTIEPIDDLKNGSPTSALLRAIQAGDSREEIILVGHMPSLAEHVAVLVNSPDGSDIAFGKGSVACIELLKPNFSHGKLHWLKHLPKLI